MKFALVFLKIFKILTIKNKEYNCQELSRILQKAKSSKFTSTNAFNI